MEDINWISEDGLNYIDPHLLIDEDNFNKLESFFLLLGVVFNDLKGLILFEDAIIKTYGIPDSEEVTAKAGNYSGMMVQVNKLFAGTVSEFLTFLDKFRDVFESREFKDVLDRISKEDRDYWREITNVSKEKISGLDGFSEKIIKIRNNLAFHFDHSGKSSRNGYISHFFGKNKSGRASKAYYSMGTGVKSTRFYFSDAAIQAAISIAAGMELKGDVERNEAFRQYMSQIKEVIGIVLRVTSSLMKQYIKSRRMK